MLREGFVPTAELAPILRAALVEAHGEEFQGGGAAGSVPRILHRWENEMDKVEFDSADRLFAQYWLTPEVWTEKLPHLYYNLTFPEKSRSAPTRCARAGCSKKIVLTQARPKNGYNAKKYCSKACGDSAWRAAKRGGHTRRAYGPNNSLRHMVCAKGHDLTDDNVKPRKDGKRICRQCSRNRDRRYQQEKRLRRKGCSQGHDLSGANLKQREDASGHVRFWCHACKLEKQRGYREAAKQRRLAASNG